MSSELPGAATEQGGSPSTWRAAWRAYGRPLPLLALFALQVGFWGGLGTTETTRHELLLAALAQIVVIGLGFVWLIKAPRQRLGGWTITRQDRVVFGLLAAWVVIATLAAVHGALAGHPLQLVLGDYYKFSVLPLIVLLAFLAVESEAQLTFVLRWIMVLFGAILVYDFARFYPQLAQGHRFTSNAVDMIPVMAPLLCYLLHEPWSRTFAIVGAVVFAEVLLTLSFGQLLGGFLGFALALVLLFWWFRKPITWVMASALAVTFAVNMMGGIPIAIEPTPASATQQPTPFPVRVTILDTYMRGKLNAAVTSKSVPSAAEAVGGSRAAEIVAVLKKIAKRPREVVFGFGLGGVVEPATLGSNRSARRLYWERPKHYLHAGLFEVLYRSGLAGVGIFLALLAVLVRRAIRVWVTMHHPFAVFAVVNAIVQGVLLASTVALMSPYMFLALSFAGLAAIERRRESAPGAHAQAAWR